MAELSYSEKPHPDQLFALRDAAERLYLNDGSSSSAKRQMTELLLDEPGSIEAGSSASLVTLAVNSKRLDRSPGLHALWLLVLTNFYSVKNIDEKGSTHMKVAHEFRWNNFATYCAERKTIVMGSYIRHPDLYSHLDTVHQIDKNHEFFDFAYGPGLELGRVSAADVVLLQKDVERLVADDRRVRQAKQGSMRV